MPTVEANATQKGYYWEAASAVRQRTTIGMLQIATQRGCAGVARLVVGEVSSGKLVALIGPWPVLAYHSHMVDPPSFARSIGWTCCPCLSCRLGEKARAGAACCIHRHINGVCAAVGAPTGNRCRTGIRGVLSGTNGAACEESGAGREAEARTITVVNNA